METVQRDPEALLPVHAEIPAVYSYTGNVLPCPPNPFICEHGFSIVQFRCTEDATPMAFSNWP